MTGWAILAALAVGFVLALLIGFVVEAANEFGNAPKSPAPYTAAELPALVRREFERTHIPDDGEQLLEAWLAGAQS